MTTKKITIIEDDTILAETLQRRLKKREYNVELLIIDDINEHSVGELNSDYVLLDLRIGQFSGLKLIEPILAQQPEAKIIVMTGFASIATAVNAIKLGASDYLPKPLDFNLLLAALEGKNPIQIDVDEKTMSPDRIEWEHIQRVLQSQSGNISATARVLGMHRRTLQRKLAKRPVNH